MNNIKHRSFELQMDFSDIYDFMIDIYHIDRRNGPAAMLFEHMQEFPWTHSHLDYKNAIWEDNDGIVGFCFFDQRLGTAFFNLKEGYDIIIPDMIHHAEHELCDTNGNLEIKLYSSQENFTNYIKDKGYLKIYEFQEGIYDYSKGDINHELPDGFTFEKPEDCDIDKKLDAIWKGFDNMNSRILEERLECDKLPSTHKTPELDVVIKNEKGDYICCAGVSMINENNCAYLEPMCTISEYRNMGLGAAAISEAYKRTKPLGATHMSSGSNQFYFNLGFEGLVKWTSWKKI